jgi:transposase
MKHGIKPAARKFSTTIKTVKKWINEFKKTGKVGLRDKSRKPKSSPNEMLPYWKFKILEECKRLKDNNKRIRAKRIKEKLAVPYSLPTILKFIKNNGYLKSKNTKKKRIKYLREIKQRYKAFEKIQVDIKELSDIPEFFGHLIDFKLPKYQFTARCIKTAGMFISYGYERVVQMQQYLLLNY